jgi:hypothetical protein
MTDPITIGGLTVDTEDINLRGRTFFFYGMTGSGKTRLASTAMDLGKCLWIITDANTNSILNRFKGKVHKIFLRRFTEAEVKQIDPKTKLPMRDSITKKLITKLSRVVNTTAFDKFVDIIEDLHVNDMYDYDFVIVDSFTTLGDMCLDKIMIRLNKDPINEQPEIKQWGEHVRNIMSQLGQGIQEMAKKANKTAIVTCHDKTRDILRDKVVIGTTICPSLTGQAGRNIGKEYEEAYYLSQTSGGKPSWQIMTRGNHRMFAKTQIDTLPDIIPAKDMSMKYLLDMREKFIADKKGGK